MIRRRSDHDPLGDRSILRWLVVADMQGSVLEHEELSAGTDLRAVLMQAVARMTADGWVIEGNTGFGYFFCSRAGKRRFVDIRTVAPGMGLYGASQHL